MILTFGGFLTTFSGMGYWQVVISATMGSVLGAIILYSIGRVLSIERIYGIIDSNIGKKLHLKKDDVKRRVNGLIGMKTRRYSSVGLYQLYAC